MLTKYLTTKSFIPHFVGAKNKGPLPHFQPVSRKEKLYAGLRAICVPIVHKLHD